jgi:hypothetical protein
MFKEVINPNYNKLIVNSHNKVITTWNIIKSEMEKKLIIKIFPCCVMTVLKLIIVKSILNYLIIPL